MRRAITALLGLAAALAMSAGTAAAATTYDFSFASPGSGAGQLNNPSGVAVNHTTGDVYVADSGNNRVVRFDADGNFISTWGGLFGAPRGIAVDNSGGPADGAVYVQSGLQVERYSAAGVFERVWGKGVNQTTGADLCTAASGNACQAGEQGSGPGHFGAFGASGPSLAVDPAGFVYAGDPGAAPDRVQKFDSQGTFVAQLWGSGGGVERLNDLAVDSAANAYVSFGAGFGKAVFEFDATDFTLAGGSASWDRSFDVSPNSQKAPHTIAIEPGNDFLFSLSANPLGCPGPGEVRIREFHPGGQLLDCSAVQVPTDHKDAGGMVVSTSHRLYLTDTEADQVHVFDTPVATPPEVEGETAGEITSLSARVDAQVSGNLDPTDFHLEYGTAGPCSANPCASTAPQGIGASVFPKQAVGQLTGLAPETTVHYRVVAANSEGTTFGADKSFHTFPPPVLDPSCPNHLARQQTRAALLMDCRAYELVSAEDAGGYDLASPLVAGSDPHPSFPQAQGRALYAVHEGGIPGVGGQPTNRGPDPYLATRDPENQRWNTTYTGIPATAPSAAPFSSTLAGAGAGLNSFAFSGPEICDPCFADGSSGIPVRRPDGALVQGMQGSIPVADPEPAGEVRKHLSGDGTHFLFASKQAFVPGAWDNGTDLTVYDRNLATGVTQIVSTNPASGVLQNGEDVAALDVSADGSRILIGSKVATDSEGNDHYDLYLHIGASPFSVEVANTPGGVLPAGMSADGSQVLFTTRDQLDDDADSSVDLFRATINGAVDIERVSRSDVVAPVLPVEGNTDACDPTPNSRNPQNWNAPSGGPTDCSVAAIAGGGGVAPGSGAVYFLSPEQLQAGEGTPGAPNLFRATPGQAPAYVTTLASKLGFGSFTKATGIAADPDTGHVYVIDLAFGANSRVRKFDADGSPVNFTEGPAAGTNALSGADAPCSAFNFNFLAGNPVQLAVDPATGNLYVPNFGAGAIGVFSPGGDCLAQFAVPSPTGIAVHPANGNLYVVSGSSVRVFTPAGAAVSTFAVGAQSPSPRAVAVDSTGRFYLANNDKANAYSASGSFISTISEADSFGVAVDTSDNVYLNQGERVVKRAPGGSGQLAATPAGALAGSVGVAVGPGGLYASNAPPSVRRFTTDLAPNPPIDSAAVLGALADAATRDTATFQTNASGNQALIASAESLGGHDAGGRIQAFHYDAPTDTLACPSCDPTLATPPSTHASLAREGLSLTDDGRAFFETGERLVQRDANSRRDVYEYSDGRTELISTGTSSTDSALLGVSADGTDAFFFTREKLVSTDQNANHVRLYTAREGGGFFIVPPAPPCAAKDECQGPGSASPAPAPIGTLEGEGGNAPGPVAKPKCTTRRARALAKRTRAHSNRAKALRRRARRAAKAGNRRAARRLSRAARRRAQAARRGAVAAKRCRAQLRAARGSR